MSLTVPVVSSEIDNMGFFQSWMNFVYDSNSSDWRSLARVGPKVIVPNINGPNNGRRQE